MDSKHFINALLLRQALKHMIYISPNYQPMIAQILHAGDGLHLSGVCQSDDQKNNAKSADM